MPARIIKEDYSQIFSSSNVSSIPILDLSDTNDSINFKSSEINYNDVFSTNDEQFIGVSYQDLLSANLRTQSALASPSKSSGHPTYPKENQMFSAEASSLTYDDKKHFNMSYHKTSAGSQDGSNGTIHVAQFHPEPGFTVFVDDSSPRESKADKPDTSVTSDIRRKLDFSERKPEDIDTKKVMQHIDTQRLSRREVNTKRSTVSNSEAPKGVAHEHATGDGSLPFFSEELDVNSTAAISAAALKDAIQKAQDIIQIAKKLMERKKGGLQSHSNQVYNEGLRVEVRKQNPIADEENRTDDLIAKGKCENVDSLLNVLSWRWKSASRRVQDDLYFRTSTFPKVTNPQNRDTNGKREPALSTMLNIGYDQQVVMHKHEYDVGERNVTRETLTKQEVSVEKEGQNEKDHEPRFIKKKVHAVVMDNELDESADKVAEDVEIENPLVSQEDGDCEKIEIEYKQKIEDEMKSESLVIKDSDYEKMTCKTQKQDLNEQKVNFQQHSEKTTANIKEETELRPRIICDEGMDERFEDAYEWVQNEDESKDSRGSESNVNGKKHTYMTEVIWSKRRLDEVNNLTIEENTSTEFHGRNKSEEKDGNFEFERSENCFGSCNNFERTGNIQTGTKMLEALQQAEFGSAVDKERDPLSPDATNNFIETQGVLRPFMFDESSKAKQQVNNESRSVHKATKEFCGCREGKDEEAKVIYMEHKTLFETVSVVRGDTEENEYKKMKNLFEVNSFEGCIPGFGISDSDLKDKEAKKRNKDFESNINPNGGAQMSVTESIEKPHVNREDEFYGADVSNAEGRHVAILKNLEASPGPILSSGIENVIQADEEMRERQSTQMNGDSFRKTIEEEGNAKADREMETEIVVEVNVDNRKEEFAMKGTETAKEVSNCAKENKFLGKNCEDSKKERQRERDRIAVERAIQEARDRAVTGAREKAERAAVERATAEVRQRMMAEARGKLEKATTAAKPPADKALVDAKIRVERAAVERATTEARARALEKASSQKTTKNTVMEDLRKSDETYIESAQRSKARFEREERIMERAAKALAEKNTRDLLAQKEEAEKNRLAESLDAEIKRWSTGKEGNLRALLSTLQYILGPGSGWQPISLTDIIMSNAVKKAYRKATLHVHPDKLQQRGASIREKYICEKVFDLLKVAWNKFSSEER
ncbi:uncharacterized protein LOC141686975 [Apium graveolens]|uniref:uncharacterized protein LOC141686975 n=1 Tax=Apium graveolens TaxID=4045 RepID=UPI003D79941B